MKKCPKKSSIQSRTGWKRTASAQIPAYGFFVCGERGYRKIIETGDLLTIGILPGKGKRIYLEDLNCSTESEELKGSGNYFLIGLWPRS